MSESENNTPAIWLDADACPQPIRDLLFRVVERRKLRLVLVANSLARVPKSDWIRAISVAHGADAADKKIVESMRSGDVVITNDIPLASAVVDAGGIAIGMRGELYDESSVKGRLSTRNFMEQMRSAGVETGGPKPHSPKDTQTFANQLDRILTRLCK